MTRLGAPLYAPTLVTKPRETTPNAEAVPARPGADRHALDHKPPGVSSIARVSSPRADRARPMATQPHHPRGFWPGAPRVGWGMYWPSTNRNHAIVGLLVEGRAGRRPAARDSRCLGFRHGADEGCNVFQIAAAMDGSCELRRRLRHQPFEIADRLIEI